MTQVSILACKDFNKQNRNFQQHAKLTEIEQIKKNKQPLKNKNTFKEQRIFLEFKTKNFISS